MRDYVDRGFTDTQIQQALADEGIVVTRQAVSVWRARRDVDRGGFEYHDGELRPK